MMGSCITQLNIKTKDYKGIHCAAPGHLSINLISINLNSMNELVHEFNKKINSAIYARSTLYVQLIESLVFKSLSEATFYQCIPTNIAANFQNINLLILTEFQTLKVYIYSWKFEEENLFPFEG